MAKPTREEILTVIGENTPFTTRPTTERIAQPRTIDKYSSYPASGLTPERLATILKEADAGDVFRQSELFEQIEEKDSQIFSVLQKRKLAVARQDWEIIPASDENKDLVVAKFIGEAIEEIENFEGAMVYDPEKGQWAKGGMMDILDAIGKGFSCNEIEWETSERQWIPKRLHYVPQKRFTFWYSTDGLTPRLLTESEPIKGIDLEPFKFIFHVHPAKSGLPSRASLLRPLAFLFLFKNFDIKDWVIFMEIFGHPLRVGKYPSGTSPEDRKVLEDALKNLGTDASAIMPDSMLIEIKEAAGLRASADLYEKFLWYCDRAIAKAILGSTLATEEGESGSYALGQVHEHVEQDLLEADCELISTTLRGQLIKPIVWLNFGRDTQLPRIKFKYEVPEDLDKAMDRDLKAVRAGMPIGVRYFRDKYGYPEPVKDEPLVIPPVGGGVFPGHADHSCDCHGHVLAADKKKFHRSLASATLSNSKTAS